MANEQTPAIEKPRRRRRLSAEVRRQDIVAAAMEIIRHHGVDKLTTRSLSEAVGVAQPTLFLHFGSKSQVLLALVDAIQSNLQEKMRGFDLGSLTPLERLRAVIRAHLGFIQEQPGIPRLLFSEELRSGDPAVRQRMEELVMFFLQFLAGLIRAGQASGELRADLDAEQCACILISCVQGLAFRWILSDFRFVLAEQADAVISTFIEGWRARTPEKGPSSDV